MSTRRGDVDVRSPLGSFALAGSSRLVTALVVQDRDVELANESLSRSKERFTAEVSNSVEVIEAEQVLANASDHLGHAFTTEMYGGEGGI